MVYGRYMGGSIEDCVSTGIFFYFFPFCMPFRRNHNAHPLVFAALFLILGHVTFVTSKKPGVNLRTISLSAPPRPTKFFFKNSLAIASSSEPKLESQSIFRPLMPGHSASFVCLPCTSELHIVPPGGGPFILIHFFLNHK